MAQKKFTELDPVLGFLGNDDIIAVVQDGVSKQATISQIPVVGSSGTVTEVSIGNLSPLFTASVANSTTTPAISFALVNQNANLVYAGPTNGAAAAPTFRSLVAADIPDLSATYYPASNPNGYTSNSGTVTSVGFTGGLISVANATTTPALTVAGTSGGIPYFSSASTWASSGALAANAIVIGGGAGNAPSTTTTGTGVLTFLGTPTSANLASAVTDGIGSGPLTFNGWIIGGNTLSGAAVLGSTSAQDITMTVGNANYKLAINGTQALNVSSTHGWLFDVSGGTITANTAYDFRSRSGDTRVLRMANQANQTLWTLGSTNGEMFMGTSTNTYISPATRGSSTPTGTGLAYRASNTGGHYWLIGASNIGAFSQIDFGITAGNMVAVSSTTGQWMRSRPAFDNLTAQTSVVYTFFELSPAINVTGGSTTLRAFDFNPTETSLTSVTKYGITIGGTTWLNGFGTRTPTALIHAGAVTTAAASLRIEAGSTTTAPSSPNSGDIWHEGTGNRLMFRQGGNSVELIGTSSVNSVSPTSPNRTITVLLNNTTYYIHAKTTND